MRNGRTGAIALWVAWLLAMAPAAASASGGRLELDGILRVKGGDISGARMLMVDHLGHCVVLTSGLDHFTLSLELNSEYLLEFTKAGHVTKQIFVNTRVPTGDYVFRQFGFPFQVTLVPTPRDANYEYSGPVAQVHFVAEIDDFGYDKDYRVKPMPTLMAVMERERARVNAGGTSASGTAAASGMAAPAAPAATQAAIAEPAPAPVPVVLLADPAPITPVVPISAPEVKAPVEAPAVAAGNTAPETREPDPMEEKRAAALPTTSPAPMATTAPPMAPPTAERMVRDHQVTQRVHVPQALPTPKVMDADREEAVVVEPLRVIRIVRLRHGDAVEEYRRVSHRYGQVVHFHNGSPCTPREFEQAVGD
ncbi:MAG: hypothetical protein JNL05_03875 [Flavobacteriales bacterium]|nr:hypothetical protein [Flavobacteriales bacterium]